MTSLDWFEAWLVFLGSSSSKSVSSFSTIYSFVVTTFTTGRELFLPLANLRPFKTFAFSLEDMIVGRVETWLLRRNCCCWFCKYCGSSAWKWLCWICCCICWICCEGWLAEFSSYLLIRGRVLSALLNGLWNVIRDASPPCIAPPRDIIFDWSSCSESLRFLANAAVALGFTTFR